MKKTIKFETLYEFQKGDKPQILANPPSKSFLTQARIALTEQLAEWIEDSFCKAHFVECLDVRIDWSGVSRSAGEKPLLPLLVEPKSDAYILLECSLIWAYRQPGRTEIPYPWLDYAGGDLRFRLIADPLDVRKMNAEIPELVTPVIRTNESGLPYDYRIKTHDGTLQIVFRGPVTDADLNAVGAISDRFFAEYNETHENKIHDVETPRKYREKSVCFGVDFGGATAAAVVDLIGSFRSVEGIRKIIFQQTGFPRRKELRPAVFSAFFRARPHPTRGRDVESLAKNFNKNKYESKTASPCGLSPFCGSKDATAAAPFAFLITTPPDVSPGGVSCDRREQLIPL